MTPSQLHQLRQSAGDPDREYGKHVHHRSLDLHGDGLFLSRMLQSLANHSFVCFPRYRPITFDLLAGRRLELEALNGAMVRLGHEHGLSLPFNVAIYAALKPYANGARR